MEAVQVNTEKEILMSLARLETKMDNLGNVKEVSAEALQSAKSAHHRLDKIDELRIERIDGYESQLKKIDKIIFWAGTTIIGGVFLGAIGLLFYFAKN
ncbi:hypothetical protein AWM68_19870 [Fictibacillus phosphorivorans]|uniref:Hemolysin XhlA n=1 Tax=Fictibacillus phosphorivorans TaxID=1221500 RepID=A0A163RKE7_9BACL|nr:hemolysin XhlA family protein [Fictibacillus phosphorivorans]KZE67001.1 hypothetical protein AWM68_19870 [Fictibacillus phosphorivorans]